MALEISSKPTLFSIPPNLAIYITALSPYSVDFEKIIHVFFTKKERIY